MSESSPADLAVAFRSLPRRLREALEPLGGRTGPVDHLAGELDGLVGRAAGLMGTPATAGDVAEAIERRHADDWADADLEAVRGLALDAGRLLRQISTAAEDAAP